MHPSVRTGRHRVVTTVVLAVLLVVAGCGSGSGASPDGEQPAAAGSSSAAGEPGEGADGTCGDGAEQTQRVRAAQGVRVTVPADWEVQRAEGGAAVGLYPPDRDAGDGFVVVEQKDQTLDEAVADALGATADSAEQTSEQDLDLDGFEAARLVTFAYDDSEEAYSVDLVAVSDGVRVSANLTRDGDPAEQAIAESCLSTLSRATD